MPDGGSVTIAKLVPALLCGLVMVLVTSKARADTRDDVLSAISRCNVIHDNKVWLDCVYGAQQPMRALLGLPPAPEYQQRLVPPAGVVPAPAMIAPPPSPNSARPVSAAPVQAPSRPATVRHGRAGFLGNLFGANPPVAVSPMTSYRFEKSGAFVVELQNGQRWRQADVEAGTANWNRPASSYNVTVTQGAFGSYTLRTADSSRTFRVERAK
jgi:hypothetical protein